MRPVHSASVCLNTKQCTSDCGSYHNDKLGSSVPSQITECMCCQEARTTMAYPMYPQAMSEILAANRSRATRLVRPLMWRMPKSVKRRLSRLRLVRLVRDDSCCRPASPTPGASPTGCHWKNRVSLQQQGVIATTGSHCNNSVSLKQQGVMQQQPHREACAAQTFGAVELETGRAGQNTSRQQEESTLALLKLSDLVRDNISCSLAAPSKRRSGDRTG